VGSDLTPSSPPGGEGVDDERPSAWWSESARRDAGRPLRAAARPPRLQGGLWTLAGAELHWNDATCHCESVAAARRSNLGWGIAPS